MSDYNIFNDSISDDVKDIYDEEYAQTAALLDAANLISEAMEEKGINQTELARQLDVSRGYVSRLLSGHENMSIKNVARVLHVLGKKYCQNTVNIKVSCTKGNILSFMDFVENVATIGKQNITLHTETIQSPWTKAQ